MNYLDKSLKEIIEALKTNQVTSEELINESLKRAHKYQNSYNSFVTILDNYQDYYLPTDGILNGIPYALKDNFSTTNILTTASSNILKDYIPIYDATAYKKLKESGAVLIGKAVLDELAMGGTGTTGHTGIVKNPWDKLRMIGGSSAGSAAAVALGIVPFALGSDTGDSIRNPAGYGGVVGYKPTYGLISRYGLFAFAASLDHVGLITRRVEDVACLLDILKGFDENDMTSYDCKVNYTLELNNKVNGKKIFYIKEIIDELKNNEPLYENFLQTLKYCEELGIKVEEVSIDKNLLLAIYPAYFTIACAEATSNNSNLTGIIFGNRIPSKNIDEIMFNTRTKGFSELIKRRFVFGSYVLQKENQEKLFKNAGRIRRIIVDKLNDLFNEYEGLIMPNAGDIAPRFGEEDNRLSEKYLLLENHLALGNFGGFPSITFPSGIVDSMPIAINITGKPKDDLTVLNLAFALEEKINFKYLNESGEIDV